ncbi:hypothetical protein [Rhizobium sp. L1K21]|uniref:hypothetical protein n=1 Tax=Rhizobium sp. L1K21 TaxID=2954933 RepID=UPI0020934649|nr:hypothetical protein [Rhizobium sp. L1K21]MCO6185488.1 hypothetical protein [Rhizobium sp. L1K21]
MLRRLWQENRLLLIAFSVAAALTLLFALRFVFAALYWHDPSHRNQPLEPWMTLRYVAHSWNVPVEALVQALDIDPDQRGGLRRRPIEDIADGAGVSYETFKQEVDAAVQQLLKEQEAR